MDQAMKCVLVIDQELPMGQIANTASVLSLTLGQKFPEIIGRDLPDSDGELRHGITTIPIPILKGTRQLLRDMRTATREFEGVLTVVDLISATATTKSYDEYAAKLAATPKADLEYFGIALYGDKKVVNKFTGSLGLLR